MEETTKKKVLGELYAIRATMSLVAENDDKTQEEYKFIDMANEDIATSNRLIQDSAAKENRQLGSAEREEVEKKIADEKNT